LGDSEDNDFFVIQVPAVEVKKDGKDIFAVLLQLEMVLPFGKDSKLYRLVLDDDGFGCTFYFPRTTSLHKSSDDDVNLLVVNMQKMLAKRSCTVVDAKGLLNNHKALFTHLNKVQGKTPETLICSQHYSFFNDVGKVKCSLDYFNEPGKTSGNEVQRVLVPFKATLRMDTTKTPPAPVKQDLFMLVWQLCVVKSVRVVTETEIEEIDELAAALQVTEG
jgi:Linear amide C-N hydrolases, choloylglycine hydrolase family